MLKAVSCVSNEFKARCQPEFRKLLIRQIPSAHISTNTAINQSLRRSHYDKKGSERRRPGLLRRPVDDSVPGRLRHPRDSERTFGRRISDLDASSERRQRLDHQQGIRVEDKRDSARITETPRTRRRLRKPLRRNEKGEFDSSTRDAKYNYESNPEGNRAIRRALKFGHKVEPAVSRKPSSAIRRAIMPKTFYKNKAQTSEEDLFDAPYSERTPRRSTKPRYGEEHGFGLSMPGELQDAIDPSTEHYTPQFSMRRCLDKSNYTSFDRPRGQDYGGPSRVSSRVFDNYGKGPSQTDDEQSQHRDSDVPLSIPYTTPASEFLYGTSAITAALLSPRRKLYKLYIYAGDNREAFQQDNKIRELALKRSVVVERVKEDGLRMMSKMSTGRPHNGFVLEASPLPKLPVAGFQAVPKRNGAFHVILDHQSREDKAVNGADTNIEYEASFPRYPFVLLLDGILDPGNLGAILRTAFFLGVDTVAISNRNSAPISPVAIKASAGASETLPLVSVGKPANFIDQCKGNGWKIYAAAAPTPGKRIGLGNYLSISGLGNPLRNQPCLLILGSEGEGVQWNIRRKADFDVGIDGPRIGRSNVDSLNVSVAAGLLCEAFLRKPIKGRRIDVNAPFDVDTWTTSPSDGARFEEDNRVF